MHSSAAIDVSGRRSRGAGEWSVTVVSREGAGVVATQVKFRGEPAVTLTSGSMNATFAPGLRMTGVSLRFRGGEYLVLPGGLDHLRAGLTGGLPLLAPWANRLSTRTFRVAGVGVDLRRTALSIDDNGLPIHGLLVGRSVWKIDQLSTRSRSASLRASFEVATAGFPFPHRIDVDVTVREPDLVVATTVTPTGRRRVPIAFGWHPYLRLPETPRSRWNLRLPPRSHVALDGRGLPTGDAIHEPGEAERIGRRRFDDLYALGRTRRLGLSAENGRSVELRCDDRYPFAQVWVPPGRQYAALEPMTAPTNALVEESVPFVKPGESFTASFTLTLT